MIGTFEILMNLNDGETAQKGTNANEVVIAISPAFGKELNKTIVKVDHSKVLREIISGIEEQGALPRIIRSYHTADLAFMGHQAAKLSGSGIGIGLQSRGTTVIHQKDLDPLSNLELFPQSPSITLETYRAIGKNAALYALGESVDPVPSVNDQMARPRYQAIAALLHLREAEQVIKNKKPVVVEWNFSIKEEAN
ncbi:MULTISPECIES: propanediol/glycerol family dehydratase medium subunit [Fictibacillus]|uniref:Propanediol utilization protein n=1 Tax=Fictibacillus enclensis TaxID=1017270 RepID=A0A0V8JF13_9BACL|nr:MULTISPECIES: propanediol/glycerol family dehydratase medium subunit [Fictibacillus]KSU85480.1 propanediol utilization protein [Fictibacillus enclensis]MDM5199405.1 propanediol/glycerol family dehydratase medium subunit [Fictibacillus enclensis]RXY98830.1 propanediol dehydratase medium subunit PduD [Fictibacillus sp. S7]SCB97502.1 propanediol dehydratase medium subunit [Fictibacillus enclensis]